MTPAERHLLAAVANAATVALLSRADVPSCKAAELRLREALHAWDAEAYAADESDPTRDLLHALTRLVLATVPPGYTELATVGRLREAVIRAHGAVLMAEAPQPERHPVARWAEAEAVERGSAARQLQREPWAATIAKASAACQAWEAQQAHNSPQSGAQAADAPSRTNEPPNPPQAAQDAPGPGVWRDVRVACLPSEPGGVGASGDLWVKSDGCPEAVRWRDLSHRHLAGLMWLDESKP